MRGGDVVLFLVDENLEYLNPLRIAHQPGVVLEVVTTDDNQGDPSSKGTSGNSKHVVGELSVVPCPSSKATSIAKDVASLRIRGTDDSQALVVSPQDLALEMALQLPTSITNHFQLETGSDAQHDQLHMLRLQMQQMYQKMEDVVASIEQIDEQRKHAQQNMQSQIDKILQTLEQMTLQLTQHEQKAQQKIEGIQQKIQQFDQDIRQQTQQEIDTVQNNVQQLDAQAQSFRQQNEVLLQKIQKMENVWQEQDRLSPVLRRQETQQALDHFVHAYHRVQAVLARHSQELPIPRLFIILPGPADDVGGCSSQFRFYFLCECGAHTATRYCNKPHEIHLADHPGYSLDNQKEFIDHYGPYLLTMMYMVKYGAMRGGLVVPPLLGLDHATGTDTEQEHVKFIKRNVSHLVDVTITHLEEATGTIDRGLHATAHQSLGPLELAQLMSYLKVDDGKSPVGGLCPFNTQEGHCTWVCCNHLLEYQELALRRLKYAISAGGGICIGDQAVLMATSETKTKHLYDAIGDACRVQNIENWEAMTNLSLDVSSHSLTRELSAILSELRSLMLSLGIDQPDGSGMFRNRCLNSLESLSLSNGRLSMEASGISRGVIRDVAFEVVRLSGLTLDDFEFFQQCQPVVLKILLASDEMDEVRLADILQHSTKLRELRVGCIGQQSFKLINSILSTREKTVLSRGQSALRTFEVIGEGLVPLKLDKSCSCYQYRGAVTALFSEDPGRFEMHVNLHSSHFEPDDTAVRVFIRQYGWSIKTLVAPSRFDDDHAKLLDEATKERGSIIEHIDITPDFLTDTGLRTMDQVIGRSENFLSVRLSLGDLGTRSQLEMALPLLRRYKDRLKSLRLSGDATGWLKHLAEAFPDKDDFPILEALCGEYGNAQKESNPGLISWLKGDSRPSNRRFCSASIERKGDKGLLHQWASS
ncbi:hypothetical protein BGX34_008035 [Mortierella sp. NVP85]|nr:hypothetical protein BGX34_008035 [Mortierella sp. NVP85]